MSVRLGRVPAAVGRASAAGVAAALVVALVGCHRPPVDAAADPTDAASEASAESPPDAHAALLPARCRRTERAFTLDQGDPDRGQGAADLEIGDGLAYPGGYAVSLVHHTGAGRVAAIALLRRDSTTPLTLTRVIDLGPTLGDAPPPRLGWRGTELVAAAYARAGLPGPATPARDPTDATAPPAPAPERAKAGEPSRDVSLYAIGADGLLGAPLSVPQRRDDSLALDLGFSGSAGLLVWDEATSAPRGVVKGAAFSKDRVSPARDISPPDSDAELPRVVRLPAGGQPPSGPPASGAFAVLWIARQAEPGSGLDGAVSEATGEARAYGWLEMVTTDVQGAPMGPVRRLTSPTGHVSAYDVEPSGEGLLVVARDDGEAVDGSGGSLVGVRVTRSASGPAATPGAALEGTDSPIALATDGLGRGAPTFVPPLDTGSGPAAMPLAFAMALEWVGKDEQARFLPLDVSGAPAAPPSAEDGLDDARPLVLMSGPSGGPTPSYDVLVATPLDSTAPLRVFACAR